MDLEKLRVFLAVVDTGSLLLAAEHLCISRSTVRRRVKELEEEVGTPLLLRGQSGAKATMAGEVLAQRGRMLLREVNALMVAIREADKEPSGRVGMVSLMGAPPHVLVPLIGNIMERYPGLVLDLRHSSNPVGELGQDVDVALDASLGAFEGPWESMEVNRMSERLIAHRSYLEARGEPETLEDLKEHELLAWHSPDSDPRLWPLLSGGHCKVEPHIISQDGHFMRHCVMQGMGIGLVLDPPIPEPGEMPGDLVRVLPDLVGRVRISRLVIPRGFREIPKIKSIFEEVKAFMAAIEWMEV